MKLTVLYGFIVLFVMLFTAAASRRYTFVPAKCVEHGTHNQVNGPLKICTFPPKHQSVPQEDINAIIKYIQIHYNAK